MWGIWSDGGKVAVVDGEENARFYLAMHSDKYPEGLYAESESGKMLLEDPKAEVYHYSTCDCGECQR